ncbi:hypothetical protein NDU88_001955 [Pleurodeles waltl]|uniref:Uncharacterized protein n=1 Tax=Pleurodeles waltl TaxID=8319 RepID=A0AAV7Q4K0_PLEWA|nr:hypothetical protein NDU88_001955 [Pleurodeles waltl]
MSECAAQGSALCTGEVVESSRRVFHTQVRVCCAGQCSVRSAGRGAAAGERFVHSASCTGQVVEQQQESVSCTDECAAQGKAPCTVQVMESSRRVFGVQVRVCCTRQCVLCTGQCALHMAVLRAQGRSWRAVGECSVHRAGRGAIGECFVHRSECATHGSAPCTGQVVEQQQESASCTDLSALHKAVLRAQGRSWSSSRRALRAQIGVRCAGQCSVHRAGRGAAGEHFVHRSECAVQGSAPCTGQVVEQQSSSRRALRAQIGVRCAGQCSVHRAGRGAAAGELFLHRSECAAQGSAPCTGQVAESSRRVFRAQVSVCCAGQCSVHRAGHGVVGECSVHRAECAAQGSAPCPGEVVESSRRVFHTQVRVCCAGQCSVRSAGRGTAAGERFVHSASCTGQVVEQQQESVSCTDECAAQGKAPCTVQVTESSRRVFGVQVRVCCTRQCVLCTGQCALHMAVLRAQGKSWSSSRRVFRAQMSVLRRARLRAQCRSRRAAGECLVNRSECAAHGSVFRAQSVVRRAVFRAQGRAWSSRRVLRAKIRVRCTRQCSVHRAGRGAAAGERFVHRSECAAQGSAPCTGQVVEQQQESASCTDECALRRAVVRARGRARSSRRVLCAQMGVRCAGQCSVHRAERGAAGVLRAQMGVRCAGQCSVHRAGHGAAAGERFVHRSECAAHGSAPCTGQVVEQQQESALCTDQSALRKAVLRAQGRS